MYARHVSCVPELDMQAHTLPPRDGLQLEDSYVGDLLCFLGANQITLAGHLCPFLLGNSALSLMPWGILEGAVDLP